MKKKLLFSLTIAVLAVFCMLSLAACSKDEDVFVPELLTVEQIEQAMPPNIMENGFGIYFYKNATEYVRTTRPTEEVPFDPTKPTVLFIHGVQFSPDTSTGGWVYNEKFTNAQEWIEAGYNVGAFLWSQFANYMPNACEKKVWTRGAGKYMFKNADGEREEGTQIMEYSLVECFGAYWFGFMSQFENYSGNEIRFQGHSLGASSLFGVCNYFLTLESAGVVTSKFLPDKVSFFDAFLFGRIDGTVPWLNKALEHGSVGAAAETVKMLNARGIATEYIKSSSFVALALIASDDYYIFEEFIENVRFFEMNVDDHNISKTWYENSINKGFSDNTNGGYAIGPNTPFTYILATQGVYYKEMSKHNSGGADRQASQNIDFIKIAGVAFHDENDNGTNDSRLKSRLAGIKVYLYEGDTIVAETVTNAGGYYEFKRPETDAGKSFTVKVGETDGYEIGEAGVGTEGNAIGADRKSRTLVLSDKEIAIINIGFIKK